MSTPHFKDWELQCRCGCGRNLTENFQLSLEQLRVAVGFPLRVSSGARCPEYNSIVSSTGLNGPHTKDAVDLLVHGPKAHVVIETATRFGWLGVGISQRGPKEQRFVHLDRRPYRTVWSY